MTVDDPDEHLIAELERVATAVGRTFPGLCEVVLHDLRDPDHTVRTIENNLSGRAVGDPATELGLARIADPAYPDVVQNYANTFPDGRPAKSTSIGVRNARGEYVAALCLNLDLSVLSPLAMTLTNLTTVDAGTSPDEDLAPPRAGELRRAVESWAVERGATPRTLAREAKRELVARLHADGWFATRDAAQTIADLLGISRASVYNYARDDR